MAEIINYSAEELLNDPALMQEFVNSVVDLSNEPEVEIPEGVEYELDTRRGTEGDADSDFIVDLTGGMTTTSVSFRPGTGLSFNYDTDNNLLTINTGNDDGSFVVVNTDTGEITDGTNTFQYLYRYLHVRFSANSDGSGFVTNPDSITGTSIYIGLNNRADTTAPIDNTAYNWTEFVWSTSHNVFYRKTGGNRIEFLTSTQSSIANAVEFVDGDSPLDFNVLEINTDNIVNAAVVEAKVATNAVTTTKIMDSAVITDKIMDSAVITDKIMDSAVITDKIMDNAVNSNKAVLGDGLMGSTTDEIMVNTDTDTTNIDSSGRVVVNRGLILDSSVFNTSGDIHEPSAVPNWAEDTDVHTTDATRNSILVFTGSCSVFAFLLDTETVQTAVIEMEYTTDRGSTWVNVGSSFSSVPVNLANSAITGPEYVYLNVNIIGTLEATMNTTYGFRARIRNQTAEGSLVNSALGNTQFSGLILEELRAT